MALYNPLSRARPWQLAEAFGVLREVLPPTTPIVFATAVSRPDEQIDIVDLADADPARADMRTLVMVGCAATRRIERPGQRPWVYTPRFADEASRDCREPAPARPPHRSRAWHPARSHPAKAAARPSPPAGRAPRGLQLGRGGPAAGILRDDHRDTPRGQHRRSSVQRERPARGDAFSAARRQEVRAAAVDAADHVVMPGRRGNGASSFRPTVRNTLRGAGPRAAAARSCRPPLSSFAGFGAQAGRSITASARSRPRRGGRRRLARICAAKGCVAITRASMALRPQMARQPLHAAEPAAAHADRGQHRRARPPGQRQDRAECGIARQQPAQSPRLRGAAEKQNSGLA